MKNRSKIKSVNVYIVAALTVLVFVTAAFLDDGNILAAQTGSDSRESSESEIAVKTVNVSKLALKELGDGTVGLFDGQVPVWNFVYQQKIHPGIDPNDKRSIAGCYFHPLYGLDGEILTINASNWDNHAHHHGVWTSFMTIIRHRPDGSFDQYDTWTDDTELKKEFVGWSERGIKPDGSFVFTARIGWLIAGKEKIMDEKTTVVTFPMIKDPKRGAYRIIDFSSAYTPVKDRITLAADRKYKKSFASLSIRFIKPPQKTLLLSKDGEIKEDHLQLEIPWIDYQSAFGKNGEQTGTAGVAVFPDKRNPKHKGGWGVRHYGLIATGWPGIDGTDLEPGQTVTLKYRLVIHEKNWTPVELAPLAEF